MFNPKDQRMAQIIECFEQMNLFTTEEMTVIEDYLMENEGKETLEQLTFRDLSKLPHVKASKLGGLLNELVYKGKKEQAARVCDVLFELGEATAYEMFMIPMFTVPQYDIISFSPAQKAALYVNKIGFNQNQLCSGTFNTLLRIIRKKEDLIEAIKYQKMEEENGKLILLAAFFRAKYPTIPLTEKMDPADAQCLEQYENILVKSIVNLYKDNYKNSLTEKEIKEITEAVEKDKTGESIVTLKKVKTAKSQSFMLHILAGMAFINYELSYKLRNVVTLCLTANPDFVLKTMHSLDVRHDIKKNGKNYDDIFHVDGKALLSFALLSEAKQDILKAQFQKNRDYFLSYMDCNSTNFETYNMMNAIVKELDLKLYHSRREKEIYTQRDKLANVLLELVNVSYTNEVKDYLNGVAGLETLYAVEDQLAKAERWGNYQLGRMMKSYRDGYGYDEFYSRCEVVMMMCRGYTYNYCSQLMENGYSSTSTLNEKHVKKVYAMVDNEGLKLKHQMNTFIDIYADGLYWEKAKKAFYSTAKEIFRKYLAERREELIPALQEAGSAGRSFGIDLLAENPEENKEVILKFAQDSAKTVKETLLEVLYKQTGWEADVMQLLSSKKAADREIAIRVLAKWDSEKYKPVFLEALEKEKNNKIRTLLEGVTNTASSENTDGPAAITQVDLVKELHKGNKKRGLAWAYETPFSKVHKKDGEEATEEYLQAIFLCYSTMGTCGVSKSAVTLAEALEEKEFAVYANELFDKWLEAGAEAKKRWVLYASAIHGGPEIVKKLHHQIQEWPQAARGAIASDAVQALALSPQPQALLIVDGISRKFKFKQVKAAAGKALEFAASQLGITTEELADRIVPNLGFDENMERRFDYGERSFIVTITPALEIEVFDENKKKLKNLPAPGKKDDPEKAAAAYEEFKEMKKQMKTTVSSQKMRLEMALSSEREWSIQAWKDLFVKNPIMHQFAIGLIWGIYENRKLVNSFRYMEDGSFNTEDEEEFELPESGAIGLVHPIDLSEESKNTWKEQLEDYEIVQPIEQLNRPVYYRTKEEEDTKNMERFGGCILNDLSLGSKLAAMGWYRGSILDAGGFYTYYREDPELSLGAELYFSGSFVGGANEDVTVYDARFYNTTTVVDEKAEATKTKKEDYRYDRAIGSKTYYLKDVPERYFSEVVLQISKAVSTSKEKNEGWKAER